MPLVYIHGVRQRSPQGLARLQVRLDAMLTRVRQRLEGAGLGDPRGPKWPVFAEHWGQYGVPLTTRAIIPAINPLKHRQYTADHVPADEHLRRTNTLSTLPDDPERRREVLANLETLPKDVVSEELFENVDLENASVNDRAKLEQLLADKDSWMLAYQEGVERGSQHLSQRPLPEAVVDYLRHGVERTAVNLAMMYGGARNAVAVAQEQTGLFLGDAMLYVLQREKHHENSPILQLYLRALANSDGPLIIVTHSAGATIAFDLLAHYAKDRPVACLVTVAGQMAQYYLAGLTVTQLSPFEHGRVRLSDKLGYFANITDECDPYGFWAEPVFADAVDIAFDTGHGPTTVHSSYWRLDSFWKLLEDTLVKGLSKPAQR